MGVTLVVGYAPDGRGGAVLHLAGMLARSAYDDLVLCTVVPSPFPGEPAQEDSEYRRFLDGMARDALERARERLPGDVSASSVVDHARSAPAGLLDVAERGGAAMIVVGTSGHPAIRLPRVADHPSLTRPGRHGATVGRGSGTVRPR